jgi:hypothetical protein
VVHVEFLYVKGWQIGGVDRTRVKPQVLDRKSVDDIPPLNADVDAMPCKSGEVGKERKCVEDSVYYKLRLEVVSLIAGWEALPCIRRDPALPHCPGNTLVGPVELDSVYSSVEILTWAEGDFLVSIVGGEEEGRNIEDCKKKWLGKAAKGRASEGDGT